MKMSMINISVGFIEALLKILFGWITYSICQWIQTPEWATIVYMIIVVGSTRIDRKETD